MRPEKLEAGLGREHRRATGARLARGGGAFRPRAFGVCRGWCAVSVPGRVGLIAARCRELIAKGEWRFALQMFEEGDPIRSHDPRELRRSVLWDGRRAAAGLRLTPNLSEATSTS